MSREETQLLFDDIKDLRSEVRELRSILSRLQWLLVVAALACGAPQAFSEIVKLAG